MRNYKQAVSLIADHRFTPGEHLEKIFNEQRLLKFMDVNYELKSVILQHASTNNFSIFSSLPEDAFTNIATKYHNLANTNKNLLFFSREEIKQKQEMLVETKTLITYEDTSYKTLRR